MFLHLWKIPIGDLDSIHPNGFPISALGNVVLCSTPRPGLPKRPETQRPSAFLSELQTSLATLFSARHWPAAAAAFWHESDHVFTRFSYFGHDVRLPQDNLWPSYPKDPFATNFKFKPFFWNAFTLKTLEGQTNLNLIQKITFNFMSLIFKSTERMYVVQDGRVKMWGRYYY